MQRSKVYVGDARNLGISQRKVMEILEESRSGMTFSEIFENANLIPLVMGSMLDVYADMRLALEGKKDFLDKEKIFYELHVIIDKSVGYLIEEDANLAEEDMKNIFERVFPIAKDIKRMDTYLKLKALSDFREQLKEAEASLSGVRDVKEIYLELLGIASRVSKIAEGIESYRREMRVIQAVGRGADHEVEQRRTLANGLKGNLHRTLTSLIERGLIAELVYSPDLELQWDTEPTRYAITKKGYAALQDVKERKGRLIQHKPRPFLIF